MLKEFFYIAHVPQFVEGDTIIKVGITNNPKRRIMALQHFDLLAIYRFADQRGPQFIEDRMKDYFYEFLAFGKEYFFGFPVPFIGAAEGFMDASGCDYRRVL